MQTSTDSNPDSGSYYLVEHGQKKGPLPLSALETMHREGALAETMAWRNGNPRAR
jgi:GYF domain 2